MEKILYIKANFKNEEDSYSLKMGRKFLEEYHKMNPNTSIKEVDLYKENLKPLDGESIGKIFSEESNDLTKYVEDILEYDKYIIVAPMWNLSIPSILKTYIDHIAIARKTFKYTENGPVGLLDNKKIIHITARGGYYSEGLGAELEMGDRYLRTIFKFMGVDDYNTFSIEGTAALPQDELVKILEKKYIELKAIAENF